MLRTAIEICQIITSVRIRDIGIGRDVRIVFLAGPACAGRYCQDEWKCGISAR